MFEIISRDEARELGLKRFCTGKLCRNQHQCERLVSNGHCIECGKIYAKRWDARYPGLRLALRNSYRERYREYNRESSRIRREKDPEKSRAAVRASWHKNKHKYLEKSRKRSSQATAARRALLELGIQF